VVIVATVATVAVACQSSDDPKDKPKASATPTPTATTPTASPTPSLSAEEAAAYAAVEDFERALAEFSANPKQNVGGLDRVAISTARIDTENLILRYRREGIVIKGSDRPFLSQEVEKVDLDQDLPTVTLRACKGVPDDVEVTKNGEPWDPPLGISERTLKRYGVSFYEKQWRVSWVEAGGRNSC